MNTLIKSFYLIVLFFIIITSLYVYESINNSFEINKYCFLLFLLFILAIIVFFRITIHLLKEKNKSEKKYYYDELTGLPNRNKLLKEMSKSSSLIILDIKNFSYINKIYGYKTGDELLKFVSESLKKEFDENVYRLEEDKFAVLSSNPITLEELSIKHHLLFFNYNQFINISFTIGASNKKENLLETATIALIHAKSQNKAYFLFDEKLEQLQQQNYNQIRFLEEALINDKIVPFYHCIVNKNKEVVKYEALIRIIRDDNQICSPDSFLEDAKKAQLYNAFSRNMIFKVINDLKEGVISKVSINLSYEDINDEIIRNIFDNVIDEKLGKRIVIEILETEGIKNYEIVQEFINNIKKKGVQIAIDDFGSGYSNFIQVLNLKTDIIKIDSSLIKNIKNPKHYKMVKLIVDFAKTFNLKTVAEFVSDEEIFTILKSIGIDEFQGFYFCKPLKKEEIIT